METEVVTKETKWLEVQDVSVRRQSCAGIGRGEERNAGKASAIRGMAGVSEVGGWRFVQHW